MSVRVSIVSVDGGTPSNDYLEQCRSHKTGRWLDIEPGIHFEGEETPDNAKKYMIALAKDPVVRACIGEHTGLFDSLVIRLLYGQQPDWLYDYSGKHVLRGGQRVSNEKTVPMRLICVLHTPSGRLVPTPNTDIPYIDDSSKTNRENMMTGGHLIWPKEGEIPDRWFVPHILAIGDEEGPVSLMGYVPSGAELDHGCFLSLTTVTNAEWNHFVSKTGFERDGKLDVRTEQSDLPVVSVNWYDSMLFASTYGCTLPTMAEWTFAAVGGSENRTYPWGNKEPTHDICCFWSNEQKTTGPVGVYTMPGGSGRFGHQHLAGNVWCWTSTKKT